MKATERNILQSKEMSKMIVCFMLKKKIQMVQKTKHVLYCDTRTYEFTRNINLNSRFTDIKLTI